MLLNYYKILNIPHKATEAEIKKAYREKAKKYHPDVNSSDEAAQIFILVNEAYEMLIDSEKRRRYDLKLEYGIAINIETALKKQREANRKKRYYGSSTATKPSPEPIKDDMLLKFRPFIYNLFFASGMFAGFLLVFIPIYFVAHDLWPLFFLLIAIPGIILVKEGYKGISRIRKKR